MNVWEEMDYYGKILDQACKGIKPTPEERYWLATHPSYNPLLMSQSPDETIYFLRDVVQIEPKTLYKFCVCWEKATHTDRIFPIIGVPDRKGEILANFEVMNYNGVTSKGKPIKMLGITVTQDDPVSQFQYQSDIGLFSVYYQCDFYDPKMRLHKSYSSDSNYYGLAMKKEIIARNKVRYFCMSPVNNSFDALQFSIEWSQISNTN